MVSVSSWAVADEILTAVFPLWSPPFPPCLANMHLERLAPHPDPGTDLDGSKPE